MSNSSDRIAVVIGAMSGIGWATARALAADGCRVTFADRNGDGARARADELGAPHTAAKVDVTDEASVQRLFDQIGPLDVVVDWGIRVNAISPGFVDTPLTEGSYLVPGLVEDCLENTALGRAGKPEEISDAVVFLCSPKSSWLTGEVLDLNGGAHLKRYPDMLGHVMKLAETQ